MHMDYKKSGANIYIRIDKDEEIVSSVLAVCEKENVCSAQFVGMGCCSEATVFSHFPDENVNRQHTMTDVLEMENITGNISVEDDGEIVLHAHAIFTYLDMEKKQHVFGGHLVSAKVLYTTEITIMAASCRIGRMTDPKTGITVWDLSDR